jgi:hypothetical protein
MLVNVIIFIVIGVYIKRGPIINGYVGRLFSKISDHVSLLLRELYIL